MSTASRYLPLSLLVTLLAPVAPLVADIVYDDSGTSYIGNSDLAGETVYIAYNNNSVSLVLDDNATVTSSGGSIYVGYNEGSAGSLGLGSNSSLSAQDLYVGYEGAGELTINSAALNMSGSVYFAYGTSSITSISSTMSNATIAIGGGFNFAYGDYSTGSLAVTLSTLQTTGASIGTGTLAAGEITLDMNSSWTNSGAFILGSRGTGSLDLNNMSSLTTNSLAMGQYLGGNSTLDISGGTLTLGTATLGGGNLAEDITYAAGSDSSSTINVSSMGRLQYSFGMTIGYTANATINVGAGATLEYTGYYSAAEGDGFITLGKDIGSTGTLAIEGGTVTAPYLNVGEWGMGEISLNGGSLNSSSINLGYTLSGSGHLLATNSATVSTSTMSILGAGSHASFSGSGTSLDADYVSVTTADNYLFVEDGALVRITSTLTTNDEGGLRLDGGYVALPGELSAADIASAYKIYVSDGAGGWLSAAAYNIYAIYYDTYSSGDAFDLYDTYSGLDLTGYTVFTGVIVPEPSTCAFIGGIGALGLALARRRKALRR